METATPAAGGNLTVTSIPEGAHVTLDGTPAGITPLTVSNLSPGPHTVVISAEGYDTALFDVNISAGEIAAIAAELAPEATPTRSGTPLPVAVLLGILAAGLAVIRRSGLR